MKKILRGLLYVVGALVLLLAAGIGFLSVKKPAQRPASTEKIEATPARLERGRYLVEHVADCLTCHSDHEYDRYGMPNKPGTLGQGGYAFGKEFAVPGVVCAQNITPHPETGIGKWTDGEIMRAIREGVDRDGNDLFPMMPFDGYRFMSDEDVRSIVVYLKTLPAVAHKVPPKKISFPVNLFLKGVPQPLTGPVAHPDPKDRVAYGRYLTIIGGCIGCHTPHDEKGAPIMKRVYEGGWDMRGPWGRNVTPNLTPHADAYLGKATREEFIARFKSFAALTGDAIPLAPKGRNTVMPWLAFSGMTEADLGSIYDFLKTLPAVENRVNAFPDAPEAAAEKKAER